MSIHLSSLSVSEYLASDDYTVGEILPAAIIERIEMRDVPKPGRPLDGIDIWALMSGEHYEDTREPLLYFDSWQLQCARIGRWKVHFSRYNFAPWMPGPASGRFNLPLPRPELYDLEVDPEEVYEASTDNPDVVADLRRRVEDLLLTFPDQVRIAWRDTMSIPVEDTPVGAPPVRRVP